MDILPHDLILRISDLLSTSERARLAVLSRELKQLVTNSWTDIRLEPPIDADCCSLRSELRIAWLKKLATQRPQTLRSLHIHLSDTDVALPNAQLHSFSQLHTLEISLCLRRSRWSEYKETHVVPPYPTMITPASLQQLSLLTCLENLRLLVTGLPFCVNVEGDGYLHVQFPLDTLASLPKLRHLHLDLDRCSGWELKRPRQGLSSGFHELKSLRIGALNCWDWGMMDAVVSHLESLHLAVTHPIEKVSFAPNLTHLWYESNFTEVKGGTALPFKTSAKLQTLTTGVRNIPQPQDVIKMSCSIASLHLKGYRGMLTDAVVKSFSSLHSLTKLTVGLFSFQGGSILRPFTCLGRLKSLCVNTVCLQGPSHLRLSEAPDIMTGLTQLELSKFINTYNRPQDYKWYLGDVPVSLPALREFKASLGFISGQISSSMLEVLDLRGKQLPEFGLLGELPHLHTLKLSSRTDFHREKETLGHSLSALPNLRELSLLAASACHDIHADTIDTLLRTLKAPKLKGLKVAIPNSDLTMSLVNFPHLQALAVVCKAVKFDCSSLPVQNYSTLNLHFMEASVLSIERFQECKEVATTQLAGPDWSYFHVYGKRNQRSNNDYSFLHSGALRLACQEHNGQHWYSFECCFNELVLDRDMRLQ